ncbi:hypothetical protein FB107DRAFT_271077 [Schizophyllum commune]
MSSMTKAQVDPGVVDICVKNVCEPTFPDFAECVCDFRLEDIEGCVARYWSTFPDGAIEIARAYEAIAEWCYIHYDGEDAA